MQDVVVPPPAPPAPGNPPNPPPPPPSEFGIRQQTSPPEQFAELVQDVIVVVPFGH
jgi:hypothetical protein